MSLSPPRSHPGAGPLGVVVVHGFTGTPMSMRPVADALVAADLPMEQPLLSGHGTAVGDMVDLGWADWLGDVESAIDAVRDRTDSVVLCGQSMGASLALAASVGRDDVAGIVAINPLAKPRGEADIELIDGLVEDGIEVAPGSGSDIADPDAADVGYDGTPLRAIRSVLVDGIEPLAQQYDRLDRPLLLFTSRQDHVVDPLDSDFLAERYGGSVERVFLERSFHVAAIDFDSEIIASRTVDFVRRVLP